MSRRLSITLYLVYVCVLQKRAKKTATKNGKNLEDDDKLVAEENNGTEEEVQTAVSESDNEEEEGVDENDDAIDEPRKVCEKSDHIIALNYFNVA
jgi:hypothetical protein